MITLSRTGMFFEGVYIGMALMFLVMLIEVHIEFLYCIVFFAGLLSLMSITFFFNQEEIKDED